MLVRGREWAHFQWTCTDLRFTFWHHCLLDWHLSLHATFIFLALTETYVLQLMLNSPQCKEKCECVNRLCNLLKKSKTKQKTTKKNRLCLVNFMRVYSAVSVHALDNTFPKHHITLRDKGLAKLSIIQHTLTGPYSELSYTHLVRFSIPKLHTSVFILQTQLWMQVVLEQLHRSNMHKVEFAQNRGMSQLSAILIFKIFLCNIGSSKSSATVWQLDVTTICHPEKHGHFRL